MSATFPGQLCELLHPGWPNESLRIEFLQSFLAERLPANEPVGDNNLRPHGPSPGWRIRVAYRGLLGLFGTVLSSPESRVIQAISVISLCPSEHELKSIARILRLSVLLGGACANIHAQTPSQWGLTVVNINNPIDPLVVNPTQTGRFHLPAVAETRTPETDSFTYAYQQVTGDFDIKVRILNVEATDAQLQDSPKASLAVRKSLGAGCTRLHDQRVPGTVRTGWPDQRDAFPLTATPTTRPRPGIDVWRGYHGQGLLHLSGFVAPDPTAGRQVHELLRHDQHHGFPVRNQPWKHQRLAVAGDRARGEPISGDRSASGSRRSRYQRHRGHRAHGYGHLCRLRTTTGPSIPTSAQVPVVPDLAPGKFPVEGVMAVNWDIGASADGNGYPADIVQSEQGPAAPIIWNDAGFGSVSRDVLVDFVGESPLGFCRPLSGGGV